MKLRDILQQLQKMQKEIGVNPVYITGGVPRDKFLNQLDKISDLDLTNGSTDIQYLAQEFHSFLKKKYNSTFKTMDDGHSTIFLGNLKIDFSSNFMVPNIKQILKNQGISNPTSIQMESFSRDFTCNALLMSLDLKNMIDITHHSFDDLKSKTIRTCLSPEITLTSNRNRVVRAIYLAAKLDFKVDDDIIAFVKNNPDSIKISTETSLNEKLNQAFTFNPQKSSQLLSQMGLWKYVPITEIMYPYYKKLQETL